MCAIEASRLRSDERSRRRACRPVRILQFAAGGKHIFENAGIAVVTNNAITEAAGDEDIERIQPCSENECNDERAERFATIKIASI